MIISTCFQYRFSSGLTYVKAGQIGPFRSIVELSEIMCDKRPWLIVNFVVTMLTRDGQRTGDFRVS